jgi:hypothetical protein
MSVPTGTVNRTTKYQRSGTRQRTLRWARSTTPSRPASAPVTKKAPNIHVADKHAAVCITRLPAKADPGQPAKLGQVVADACPILAKSSVELAARRRRTQLPHSLPLFTADDLGEDE